MKKVIVAALLSLPVSLPIHSMHTNEQSITPKRCLRKENISLIKSIINDIHAKDEKSLKKTLGEQEIMAPVLEAVLACGDFENEWFSQFKTKLLETVLFSKGFATEYSQNQLKKMDVLLKYGANPNAMTEGLCTCIAFTSHNADALSIFLKHGTNPNSLYDKDNTLLMYAMKEYTNRRQGNYKKDELNILLFFGADIYFKINGRSVFDVAHEGIRKEDGLSLIKDAHARRVNRLAQYLTRCTYLPKDVTLKIAQHHYGRLSEEDKKLMKEYPPFDYKKSVLK